MSHLDIGMDGLSVTIGIPAGRDLHPLTVKSLVGSIAKLVRMGVPWTLEMITGSSVIQWARDDVVDAFLATGHNRLFMIDSDIVWKPEDFLRMLAISKLVPVVVAAYPAKVEGLPTFYVKDGPDGFIESDYGLWEIEACGAGFAVVRREVIEALAAKAEKVLDQIGNRNVAAIHRIDSYRGTRRGEDVALFHDIRDAGYKILLDPEVELGHIGVKVYRGSIKSAIRPRSATPFA